VVLGLDRESALVGSIRFVADDGFCVVFRGQIAVKTWWILGGSSSGWGFPFEMFRGGMRQEQATAKAIISRCGFAFARAFGRAEVASRRF